MGKASRRYVLSARTPSPNRSSEASYGASLRKAASGRAPRRTTTKTMYREAHRENFALAKIAEQEEAIYGRRSKSAQSNRKRMLPAWLRGKESVGPDGSHYF